MIFSQESKALLKTNELQTWWLTFVGVSLTWVEFKSAPVLFTLLSGRLVSVASPLTAPSHPPVTNPNSLDSQRIRESPRNYLKPKKA